MRFGFILIILLRLFTFKTCNACPPIQPPPYGSLVRVCGTQIDDNCFIDCEPGYDIIGSCYRVCLKDNTWSGIDTQCINPSVSCEPLTPPENGEFVFGCQHFAGVVCESRCKMGYTLTGKSKTLCLKNGTWSEKLPTCLSSTSNACPPVTAPTHGGITKATCGNSIGTVCEFYCNPGFQLNGQTSIKCLASNTWSSSVPTCVKSDTKTPVCPQITAPENGGFKGQCQTPATIGQTCTIECNAGYLLTGSPTIVCRKDAKWSDSPICVLKATCSVLNPPINGLITGQCSPGIVGRSCIFTCKKGFEMLGVSKLVCENSFKWSSPVPKCVVGCPSLLANVPANGNFKGHCGPGIIGEQCTVVCDDGYSNLGSSSIRCNENKQWDGPVPQCQRNACVTLIAPRGGLFINQCVGCPKSCVGTAGQTCTLICSQGYTMQGTPSTVCQSSTRHWKPIPATCRANASLMKSLSSSSTCKPGSNKGCETKFRDASGSKLKDLQSRSKKKKAK
ncbi:P-selectin-like protein [Leptotrombidium deliense]|uniref:P-selectin-like protein n=1 Tax=Leptotrombidium deliense TaxID=299467 RepID=A0A443SW84_9ACAR|nr:P-selectin-like protein [Leptotrombidium deliense]